MSISLPGPLGCGGAPLGNLFEPVSEETARATLVAAWDHGVRLFDTAPFYGLGLSERRFGEALRTRPRGDFVLSTKVGRLLTPDSNAAAARDGFVQGLPFRADFDYSYHGTRRSIEDSLHRLGLARIDVVYIHDVGEDTHGDGWREAFAAAMHGAVTALREMRADGTIAAWGLGVNRIEPCLMALERSDPDVFLIAGRYTLLDTAALDDLLPRCAGRGVQVVVGGPYNSGLLAGGATFDYAAAPPALAARAEAIGAICQRHGVDLKAAALQFCAAGPAVASVIPGARTPLEVEENVRLMAAPIPAALWDELRREHLIPEHAPTPRSSDAGAC